MTIGPKTLIIGGALVCGLGLPQVSFGLSGCNNGYLMGAYLANISSMNFQQVLQTMNTPAAATGSTGNATGSTMGNGLGGSTNSLSAAVPGLGRFFFDGAGNIVGKQTDSSGNSFSAGIGKYQVNDDCTARMTLSSGQMFDAVIVNHGQQVLFMETDAQGAGASGTLQAAGSCVALSNPGSFGFNFFGATRPAAASGSTGSTGTTAAAQFQPYSAIGTLSTDGNGNFILNQSVLQNGTLQRNTAQGTYTVGVDCSLQLQFSPSANSSSSTTPFVAPALFRGLALNGNGGLLALEPNSTDALTGSFINQ